MEKQNHIPHHQKCRKKDMTRKRRNDLLYAACCDPNGSEVIIDILNGVVKTDLHLPGPMEMISTGTMLALEHDLIHLINHFIPYLTDAILISTFQEIMHQSWTENKFSRLINITKQFKPLKTQSFILDSILRRAIHEDYHSYIPSLLQNNAKIQLSDFLLTCVNGKESLFHLLITYVDQTTLLHCVFYLSCSMQNNYHFNDDPKWSYAAFRTSMLALKKIPDDVKQMEMLKNASKHEDEELFLMWPFPLNRNLILSSMTKSSEIFELTTMFRILGPRYLTDDDILQVQLFCCKTNRIFKIEDIFPLRPQVTNQHIKTACECLQVSTVQFLLDRGADLKCVPSTSKSTHLSFFNGLMKSRQIIRHCLILSFKTMFHDCVVHQTINRFIGYRADMGGPFHGVINNFILQWRDLCERLCSKS